MYGLKCMMIFYLIFVAFWKAKTFFYQNVYSCDMLMLTHFEPFALVVHLIQLLININIMTNNGVLYFQI